MTDWRFQTSIAKTEWRFTANQSARRTLTTLLSISLLLALSGCPASDRSATDGSGSSAEAKPYALGAIVSFSVDGNGARYTTAGWSRPEPGHTWSHDTSAALAFHLEPSDTPLRLRMRLKGLTKAPELPFQPVEVLANGSKIAEWEVSADADHTAEIPVDLARSGGTLRVELKIPQATSPKQLGLGSDARGLGVALHELTIESVTP